MTLLKRLRGIVIEAQTKGYYSKDADGAMWLGLPALLDVAVAARDFMDSDGDYFSWTEDERHCFSKLRDAVINLEETEI